MRSRTPKLLHPICGWPMIAWPVAAARAAGASKIVVVDAPGEPLRADLDEDVTVAIQAQPLGTGDALKAASEHFGSGSVVVLYGDVPLVRPQSIVGLVQAHEQARDHADVAATMLTAMLDDPGGYGRVVRDDQGAVLKVVETKKPGDATEAELQIREVNTGIYVFDAATLGVALDQIRNENVQGEYYLTDVLSILRGGGHSVGAFALEDTLEMLNVNDRRALAAATTVAQRRINDTHMLAGATVIDSEATVIDADVTLGEDVTIEPGTALHGHTTVGDGSTIGPHTTLHDVVVGSNSKVIHSYATQVTIADNVSVGPFSYLRPGTELHDGSKAGAFVEIKNSRVGQRSKVPHLSYIGDATIGEDTNLGASTITANYDGREKHRTTIGSRVHTSVDTTLVAPVELGDDAYTGAGSVITEDVPEGALGIARPRQANIGGYAEKARGRPAAGGARQAGTDGTGQAAAGGARQAGTDGVGQAEADGTGQAGTDGTGQPVGERSDSGHTEAG
jgi:bifunctional UDP-N-acetylglucosamine pyrophosphorylase / glucosamine-1-phosphate N-acetyltransferase